MIPYIFHAVVLIVLFYLLYQFLLSKETFFGLNRYLLMVSIALAFALPLYEVPQAWSIWEAPVQVVSTSNTTSELAELETTFQPIEETKNIVLSNQEGTSKKQLATDNQEIIEWNAISIWQVLWTIYLIGVGIFSINLLIQLATLIYKIVRLPSLKDGQFRIVELDKDEPPYSFLNCIFINPEKYDWETYNQIIEHEKIHVQQRHSLDMLLAELLVVLQWFNPAAWQYRKMIEHNLEFLTDQAMLVQGAKRETYQLNLLKVSVPQYPIGLAMNYNQSILKKRIKMMNAKKSSVQSSWKYLTILPVFALSIILLNGVKAQQVALETEVANLQAIDASTDISNNEITENQSIPVAINQQEEIQEAVVSPEVNTESQTLNISEEVRSEMEKYPILEGDLKGFWQAQINGNEVCVRFDNSNFNKGNMWMTTECFGANEFTNPPSNGRGTFTLSRAAGTIELVGEMEDDYGQGRYTFTSSDEFESYLAKKGIRDLDEKYLFHLFTANISPAYFDYMKQQGLSNISKKQLRSLAIHRLDLPYLKDNLPVYKQQGFSDVSIDKLIALKIHNVDKDYIKEMADIGFDDLSLDDLKKGKIHNVDTEYVKEIRALGYRNLDFNDFVDFSIHNVDTDLVETLADMGFKDLPAQKLKSASIHNVSARYIKELKSAGYDIKDIDELIKFKIHNVNIDFIERMKKMGYDNLTAQQITSAAIHNVNIRDIEGLRAMGYKDLTIQQAIKLSIHNVDADYVKELHDLGYQDISIQKVTNAKIHNVRPSFVRGLNDLGFKNIPFNEIINLKIHNVSLEFIKRAQAKGMKDLSLSEYKKLKIHGIVN